MKLPGGGLRSFGGAHRTDCPSLRNCLGVDLTLRASLLASVLVLSRKRSTVPRSHHVAQVVKPARVFKTACGIPESEPSATDNEHWDQHLRQWAETRLGGAPLDEKGLLGEALPTFERIMIESTLAHTAGRKRDASILLGWGRNTLTRKMHELNMDSGDSEES